MSELIDHYIDRNGIKADTEYMVSALNQVYGEILKLQALKVDMKGLSGLAGIGPGIQQAKAGLDALSVATKQAEDRIAKMNGQSREFTQVLLLQTKAQKEAAQTALLEAKAANETAKAKQNEAKATEQSAKAKAAEKKAIDDATNDYLQLSRAYNEAALKAKNYVLRLGEGHPISIQAVKDANDLSNILKKLDASVGQNFRSVGNYKTAFDGLGFSFVQVARELPSLTVSLQQFSLAISNNLPMVADELKKAKEEIANLKNEGKDAPSLFKRISGAIFSWQVALSLAITAGTYLLNMLRSTKKETKDAADAQETYNKALADARREVAEEVADVKVLVEQIKQENLTKQQRIATIKELQRIAPNYFGTLNEEKATVDQVRRSYDAFTASMQKSVEARVLNKQLDDIVEKRMKLEETLGIGKRTVETAVENGRVVIKQINAIYSDQAELTKNQAEYNKLKEDEAKIVKRLASIQQPQTQQDKKTTEDKSKKAKEEADKKLEALFEVQKVQLEYIIQFNKDVADDESRSYADRLESTRIYIGASDELLKLEAETKKKLGKKTKEELLAIDTDLKYKLLALTDETAKMRANIWKKGSVDLSEGEAELQKKLEAVAVAGFKRFQENSDARLKLEKETGEKLAEQRKKIIEDERKAYEDLYKELTGLATDFFTAQQDREIANIEDKINALEAQKNKDIEVSNQTIANADEREKAVSTIEARAAAQKAGLDKQKIDAERKKRDIEKLGQAATVVGETAQGIANLSIKAAEAKAQASVLASNPFTAAFASVALVNAGLIAAQIPIVAGIGAAQLARILIPRYKHGKNVDDLYEGPAIVDDGGKPEAIIREDGTVEIGSNTPRLTYVKSRDIVLPDASKLADYVLSGKMGTKVAPPVIVAQDSGFTELRAEVREVVKAIKSKPELTLKSSEGGLAAMWKHGANQISYINESTNW